MHFNEGHALNAGEDGCKIEISEQVAYEASICFVAYMVE